MSKPVSISLRTYGHTAALKSGEIPVDGEVLDFVEVVPQVDAFRRMVRQHEFDICELAPTTYFIAKCIGTAPYTALPVFFERRFHHGGFVVREESDIVGPKGLEGSPRGGSILLWHHRSMDPWSVHGRIRHEQRPCDMGRR